MSTRLTLESATAFVTTVLRKMSCFEEAATSTARHLATNELAGYPSHGLARLSQYASELEAGEISPVEVPCVDTAVGGRIVINGRRALGPWAMEIAVTHALTAASTFGLCLVSVRQSGHVGRLGAYVEEFARQGIFAMAVCSGPRAGHRVAPFGGLDGRLATNPIAFAAPTRGEPVVADFSTSSMPEGRVRLLASQGRPVPDQVLQDAEGSVTLSAKVLYGTPPGSLLPLGGKLFGHKGTALGLLVELLATTLVGESTPDEERVGNNVTLLAVPLDDGFAELSSELVEYLKSSRSEVSTRPVLVPGEPERIAQKHPEIVVPVDVAQALKHVAQKVGVHFENYVH